MAQIDLLMTGLRRRSKAGKPTYAGIAKALALSESAVMRMLARSAFRELKRPCARAPEKG